MTASLHRQVFDMVNVGSSLSMRSMQRFGSAMAVFGTSAFNQKVSILDFLYLGSSLSLRSFARIGSAISTLDFVRPGASFS